jgi:hypothetical protein
LVRIKPSRLNINPEPVPRATLLPLKLSGLPKVRDESIRTTAGPVRSTAVATKLLSSPATGNDGDDAKGSCVDAGTTCGPRKAAIAPNVNKDKVAIVFLLAVKDIAIILV